MIQKIKSKQYLTFDDGLELTKCTNPVFYIEQGNRKWELTPEITSDNTMTVVIPKEVAIKFTVKDVKLQVAWTDKDGNYVPTVVNVVPISEFIGENGYGD